MAPLAQEVHIPSASVALSLLPGCRCDLATAVIVIALPSLGHGIGFELFDLHLLHMIRFNNATDFYL